jgi:prolipoprotein diacylglyceryltransferase
LLGAVVGAKLGMLLFTPPEDFPSLIARMLELDFSGKTVVGGIAGGYIGVELTKKRVGITRSTGDGWAVALPLGQAIGRIGCFLNGCCYGRPTDLPWGIALGGVVRHPAQLYEAGLDFLLAGALFLTRRTPRPEGHLFRRTLVGYASIRFMLEFLRGDTGVMVGPLTAVQVVCLAAAIVFGALILRGERPKRAAT